MDELHRHLAPLSARAWEELERTAKRVLTLELGARALIDVVGPLGWEAGCVNTGKVDAVAAPRLGDQVTVCRRRVQPFLELRVPFELARTELDAVDRGARDAELGTLIDAATRLGRAENRTVFSGFGEGGIGGICERSPHAPLTLPGEDGDYPGTVAEGIRLLREAGVDGPYGLALGPRAFTEIHRTTGPGGYPVLRTIRDLTGGPVAWAPALDGAVLLSTRGEDFELALGRDASIGYLGHSAARVELYLVESFTFRVLAPEAAVALRHGG